MNLKFFLFLICFHFYHIIAGQPNHDSTRLKQILNIANKFDTTQNYRCSFQFGLGKYDSDYLSSEGKYTIYGRVDKNIILGILRKYCHACKKEAYGKIDQQLFERLELVLDQGIYNLRLRYRVLGDKVIELDYLLHNEGTFLVLAYYLPLNENGEIIK
jgi:hypothetical protein